MLYFSPRWSCLSAGYNDMRVIGGMASQLWRFDDIEDGLHDGRVITDKLRSGHDAAIDAHFATWRVSVPAFTLHFIASRLYGRFISRSAFIFIFALPEKPRAFTLPHL